MEPMHIGSSPSSPSPSTNPNYLPAYLMGENHQPLSPNSPAVSPLGPGRNRTPVLRGPSAMTAPNLRQKLFNQSMSEFSLLQNSPVEKTGPPKQGLFDSMDKPGTPVLSSTMKPTVNDPYLVNTTMMDTVDCGNESLSILSQLPNDSMNNYYNPNESSRLRMHSATNQGGINTLWVTVFGFPANSINLMLTHMGNCGMIVEKKFPSQGNWMHLKYSSIQEVANALHLNAKLIANSFMVGVVPYYSPCELNKENLDTSSHYTSPIRARSLRNSNVTQVNANNVVSPQNVPQKSTGIVTKAMEYVFGW